MKKIFISADIEGTAGIVAAEETDPYNGIYYPRFAELMTREVGAAALGAQAAGVEEILVKDAHWNARNILFERLPERVNIMRGWSGHPFHMMAGLDDTFDGVVYTGYHSAAGTNMMPISHTYNGKVRSLTINGRNVSEFYLNSLTCAYVGVPVICICGDQGVCEEAKELMPWIKTVATIRGEGAAVFSKHPCRVNEEIRGAVEKAVAEFEPERYSFKLPEYFDVKLEFSDHKAAYRASFYPGAKKISANTISFSSDNWWSVLCFIGFVL